MCKHIADLSSLKPRALFGKKFNLIYKKIAELKVAGP